MNCKICGSTNIKQFTIRYENDFYRCLDCKYGWYERSQEYKKWTNPWKDIDITAKINQLAVVNDYCKIGARSEICEFSVIGSQPYMFQRDEYSILYKNYDNNEGVIIENDVYIGTHVSIEYGIEKPTVIKYGTKVDNHVLIGEETTIDPLCIIVGGSNIAGHSIIGKKSFIGLGVNIKPKITIGENVLVGMGSTVIKDIPDNEIWAGNPARFIKKNTWH